MTTQVIATEKYQRLFHYLADKQKEWAAQGNGYASSYIRNQGTDALAQELASDRRFTETKIVGFITSPSADEILEVINAVASPLDFQWVLVANVLRDAVLLAAGRQQRNKQMMTAGAVALGTLLWGLFRHSEE